MQLGLLGAVLYLFCKRLVVALGFMQGTPFPEVWAKRGSPEVGHPGPVPSGAV